MFELLGEFFPSRGQEDKGDAGLFAPGLIRQFQHGPGALAIILRTAGSDRPILIFVHPGFPILYAIEPANAQIPASFHKFFSRLVTKTRQRRSSIAMGLLKSAIYAVRRMRVSMAA